MLVNNKMLSALSNLIDWYLLLVITLQIQVSRQFILMMHVTLILNYIGNHKAEEGLPKCQII